MVATPISIGCFLVCRIVNWLGAYGLVVILFAVVLLIVGRGWLDV